MSWTAFNQTGEPAVTENRLGKGTAVLLGWDASYAVFQPGHVAMEGKLRHYTMDALDPLYACNGAVVYRIATSAADHYFFINDGEPIQVKLDTKKFRYTGVTDPVTGEKLLLGTAIALEGYSGRWLRYERPESRVKPIVQTTAP